MERMNFNLLVGEEASLYYCNDTNRFQLGSILFEVIEDPNDGYRSSMQEVVIVSKEVNGGQFLDNVIVVVNNEIDGFSLISKSTDHKWLEFGTDRYDHYYPTFVFKFYPKDDILELKDLIK